MTIIEANEKVVLYIILAIMLFYVILIIYRAGKLPSLPILSRCKKKKNYIIKKKKRGTQMDNYINS